MVALAGLRSMRDPGRLTSYFERGEWHELGPLDQRTTLEALERPAAQAGRPFERRAGRELAAATGGYPYAIQLYGHHAWRSSQGQDRLTTGAVRQWRASRRIVRVDQARSSYRAVRPRLATTNQSSVVGRLTETMEVCTGTAPLCPTSYRQKIAVLDRQADPDGARGESSRRDLYRTLRRKPTPGPRPCHSAARSLTSPPSCGSWPPPIGSPSPSWVPTARSNSRFRAATGASRHQPQP